MSMEIVQLGLMVWRSKMWETTLESTGNREKILYLLSEVGLCSSSEILGL